MSSIEKRTRTGKVTLRAHYRDLSGRQHNRSFTRKTDAERYLTAIESSKLIGSYIDPSLSKLTLGVWSHRWLEGQSHLKPSTRERYAGILREHIVPKWGHVKLSDVSHADVQRWVTSLTDQLSAATVRKVHRVLSLVIDLAVKDGRLVRNPATGVNLPRVVMEERRYLTHEQVELLARACASPADLSKHRRRDERENDAYRLVVLFLAYTGVRFGELAALRVGRLDFLRRRAVIVESVTLVNGVQSWGTPKGHERREVPIPPFLIEELAAHVAGRGRDELVFAGVRGGGA